MFSAIDDEIVSIDENRNRSKTIPSVFKHIELEADHLSFLVGKNMTYVDQIIEMIEDIQ